MEKSNNWLLPVSIGIGVVAFGGAWLLMPEGKKDAAPLQLQPIIEAAVKDDKQPGAVKLGPDNAEQKRPDVAPPPSRKLIQLRLNVTLDKPDKWGNSPFDVHDLAINANATRLITKSKKEVICWDLTTGRKVQTFLPPKPAWEYQEPTANRIFMSPDTRLIATLTQTRKSEYSLELCEAETKRPLGTARPDKDILLLDNMLPAFTPAGSSLLLHGSAKRGGLAIQAVDARNAALINVHQRSSKVFSEGHLLELLPVPNEPILILVRRQTAKSITALDLRTGEETPITGITNKPWHLFFERGVDVSADGKYVLAAGIDEVQVCEWRTNRQVFKRSEGDVAYVQPRFTPDGKRFLFMRQPQFDIIYFGGVKSGTRETPPCTIELYEIASQKKIGELTLDKEETVGRITALALSQDGKTLAIANHTTVLCLDFHRAFGVAPLSPLPRPAKDALPLK